MRTLLVLAAVTAALPAAAHAAPAAGTLAAPTRLVDPRAGGLEISLGEWAIAAEARAVRPGRVTFVVRNGGTHVHGLRIRQLSRASGGDRFKMRTVELLPGRTTRFTTDLRPGVYELWCFVSDHDDLGMQLRLEVRADAPLQRPAARAGASPHVEIAGFVYRPATISVKVGATVRWTNKDAAPHTVTAASGAFTSKELGRGGAYTRRFDRAGSYAYLCALHPGMRARVVVGR